MNSLTSPTLLSVLNDALGSSDCCFSNLRFDCSLSLPTELKHLLALSQEHKFPSKCPQYFKSSAIPLGDNFWNRADDIGGS